MNECSIFQSTLHYETPAHGGWGVVRIGMLAPESYQLFVCPFACGRHGALGAVQQGLKDRISYYFVDQSDIINGYDHLILKAVEELLEQLDKRPRALFVLVSCLDDLIGTDCDAVEQELNSRHPDIACRIAHMNPISLDSDEPPPVGIQKRVYSLLGEPDGHDGGVNSIGNLVALNPDCELHKMLKLEIGQGLRHVSQYSGFDTWQEMARSSNNLVFTPAGVKPAQDLEERCKIPYRFFSISYDWDVVAEQYRSIHEFLCPCKEIAYDFSADQSLALEAVQEAKERIGALPILIDSSAVSHPFGLAKALCKYGFNVRRVFAQEVIPSDREAFEWVRANLPETEILQPQHSNTVKFDKPFPESLAIGFDGAYISGSRHIVDLFSDEGLFGYYGITQLMKRMSAAMDTEADLQALIENYGLVV